MSEQHTVSLTVDLDLEHANTQLRQLETVCFRILGLIRRFSGDERIDAAIRKIQEFIMLIRQLQIAITLFWAASGPLGWAMFGISAVTAIATGVDFFDVSRGV